MALENVQIANTKGMNRDKINPACSPSVATSDFDISPSYRNGSKVESTSNPPSTIFTSVRLASQLINDSTILLLASVEPSEVDRYIIE